jgi:putative N6-adenine-specific DNA methylase
MNNPKTSLEKRIKRHVIGRERDFFVATAPGLEALCRDELKVLLQTDQVPAAVPGGVEFRGRLTDCYLANLCLGTATRILMRIDQFKATRFDLLEKKTAEIPWELYLHPGTQPGCHVTTSKSRLYHTDAVTQRIQAEIAARLADFPHVVSPETPHHCMPQNIFVRVEEDRFTFSLDSSGAPLYKRGIKTQGGRAPLRETLAAALLMRMGYTGREVLLDPLCGAGTFSFEAVFKVLDVPPGWFREFAFWGWPAFRPATWAYILRGYENRYATPESPMIYASDSDETACRMLRQIIADKGFGDIITVSKRNFFDVSPSVITDQTGCIALNPPYGLRLGKSSDVAGFLEKVFAKLQSEYIGWRLGLVLPAGALAGQPPFPLKSLKVLHGGLRLKLCTGVIKGS